MKKNAIEFLGQKLFLFRIVVVGKLIECSLPTPEIRGSSPGVGKIISTNCTVEKTKIKKKWPGMAHL